MLIDTKNRIRNVFSYLCPKTYSTMHQKPRKISIYSLFFFIFQFGENLICMNEHKYGICLYICFFLASCRRGMNKIFNYGDLIFLELYFVLHKLTFVIYSCYFEDEMEVMSSHCKKKLFHHISVERVGWL